MKTKSLEIPPHDEALERNIIHLALMHLDVAPRIFSQVHPSAFYTSAHSENYRMLYESYRTNGTTSPEKLSQVSMYTLPGQWISPIRVDQYIQELIEFKKKRSLLTFAQSIIAQVDKGESSDLLVAAMNSLSKINSTSRQESNDAASVVGSVEKFWEEVKGKDLIGFDTGIPHFNRAILGYRPSHYWVIGAYTNYGKTTLAAYMVSQFIKLYPTEPVAFFSAEMTKEQVLEKILVQYCNKPYHDLRNNPDANSMAQIKTSGLRLYDDLISVEDIRLELLSLKIKNCLPKVVFVDFIQNLNSQHKSEYESISYVTRELQKLCAEMQITIVALSQVSNEGARSSSEVIPFKGSGGIAASADFAVQLIRDKKVEMENSLDVSDLAVIISKNRHGQAGRFTMNLNLKTNIITQNNAGSPAVAIPLL